MIWRRKRSPSAASEKVEIWRDTEGVLVMGPPPSIEAVVNSLRGNRDRSAVSPVVSTESAAIAATAAATLASDSSSYVRLTPESLRLLEQHGAVPNGTGGLHAFVQADNGQIVGNLEFVASNVGPEQALAMQSAAIGLALRTAIKDVEAAVARVEDKVDQVVALLRADRLGSVMGDLRTLERLVEHLDAGEPLTGADWESVASLGPAISRDLERVQAHLWSLVEEVEGSWRPKQRLSEADELLADGLLAESLDLLLVAEHNVCQWQRLRLQRIADTEPHNLESAVRLARATLADHLTSDQEFIDAFVRAQNLVLESKQLDGLAVFQNRALGRAEDDLIDLTEWFAGQRTLDYEPVETGQRPGVTDSARVLLNRGRSEFFDAVDRVPRPARFWSEDDSSA